MTTLPEKFDKYKAKNDGVQLSSVSYAGDDKLNSSKKYDVKHKGKHIASIYGHPNHGDGEPRWEVMKPHSNEVAKETFGDEHHDYENFPDLYHTREHAITAIKKHHKIE